MISLNQLQDQNRPSLDLQADGRGRSLTQLRRLLASRPIEAIASGEIVLLEGSSADYVFELLSGCVRRYMMRDDGRRTILDFRFDGDIFGALFDGSYLFTAEAVTVLEVRRMSRAQLRACIGKTPELTDELLSLAHDDLSAAQDHLRLLGCKHASDRVAHFLHAIARQLSRDGEPAQDIQLPMNRHDIADFLGLTIESVSRALTQLRMDGLISLHGPRNVVFEDREGHPVVRRSRSK